VVLLHDRARRVRPLRLCTGSSLTTMMAAKDFKELVRDVELQHTVLRRMAGSCGSTEARASRSTTKT
jgi:hypothetical protein